MNAALLSSSVVTWHALNAVIEHVPALDTWAYIGTSQPYTLPRKQGDKPHLFHSPQFLDPRSSLAT